MSYTTTQSFLRPSVNVPFYRQYTLTHGMPADVALALSTVTEARLRYGAHVSEELSADKLEFRRVITWPDRRALDAFNAEMANARAVLDLAAETYEVNAGIVRSITGAETA